MSAIRPISVADPVAVTTTAAVPRVTCVFWKTRLVRSPSNVSGSSTLVPSFATGALSPVSAASWSSRVADVTIRPSAGTTSPASSRAISPGTSCVDSTSSTAPSRRTRACGTCKCASASTLARALSSCAEPITTLNVTRPTTKIPVGICPTTKLATATISSMMFIGLDSCPRATSHTLGGGSCGSSLGPYCSSRRSTSAASSPRSGSTPSSAATSSADRLYGTAWGLVCSIVVISVSRGLPTVWSYRALTIALLRGHVSSFSGEDLHSTEWSNHPNGVMSGPPAVPQSIDDADVRGRSRAR